MPIKRVKDRSRLAASLRLRHDVRPHYLRVFLWEDQAALVRNTVGMCERTKGCHCPLPYRINLDTGEARPGPLLAEIHLIKGEWTMEIVAHEIMHAALHSLRVLGPKWDAMVDDMEQEEKVCHLFGRWVADLYRTLWEIDPGQNWIKKEAS